MARLNAMNFTRNGLTDWSIQRFSAVVLGLYTVCVLGFMYAGDSSGFAGWQEYFSSFWMQVFTILALFRVVAHTWIGLWTVSTDYIKSAFLRVLFQVFFIVVLTAVVWAVVLTLWRVEFPA